MKKLLIASLLPLVLAAHAAPDAGLAKQSALLRELQKSAPEMYNAASGATLAEAYRALNPQLLERISKSSDATFARYADRFVKSLAELGKKDAKACHTFLTGQQTPTLPELQLLLGTAQTKLDPALKALIADKGEWQLPAGADPGQIGGVMEKIQAELQAEGKADALAYTLGGETPADDAQFKAACDAGVEIFKRLNKPEDQSRILALRLILGR